jgi:rhamnogalacturonyl hydrolase YesR
MIGKKVSVASLLFGACLLVTLSSSGADAAVTVLPPQDSVLYKMHYVDSHFIKRWPTSGCNTCLSGSHAGNIWTRGVYFEGHMALYQMAPDSTLYAYATTWGTFFNWAFNGGNGGANANGECAGQAYAELYQADTTQKIRMLNDTSFVNAMKRGTAVNYWTWIDAIHMAMTTFAEVGAIRNDTAAFTTMHKFFEYPKDSIHKTGLWDTVTHLWFRDSTFLSPAYGGTYLGPDKLPCFWSRGNGWVISALCRTLNYLPVTDVHRAEYVQVFQQMCAALLPIQRTDGFWNMDLGDPNNCGGPEETGTGCFTYAMAWGINHGFLDTATYLPAVVNGWHALDSCIHPMTDTVVLGWVQGSGSAPSQTPPVTYAAQPNFDDYGVGIFLLAGSEVYKLAPKAVTATVGRTAQEAGQPKAYLQNNVVQIAKNWRNNVGISLLDINGRTVFFQQDAGTAGIRLPAGLRAGVYLLRVKSAGITLLDQKVVIAH